MTFSRIYLWQNMLSRVIIPSCSLFSRAGKVIIMNENDEILGDYICIKALENGVQVIGMTRGRDTRFHHTEKIDAGEVMIAQFTENTSAIKIRGKAEILTKHGNMTSGKD
jgi:transcription attenuation protein (tryptophan RNA-binding attenuator protein)